MEEGRERGLRGGIKTDKLPDGGALCIASPGNVFFTAVLAQNLHFDVQSEMKLTSRGGDNCGPICLSARNLRPGDIRGPTSGPPAFRI